MWSEEPNVSHTEVTGEKQEPILQGSEHVEELWRLVAVHLPSVVTREVIEGFSKVIVEGKDKRVRDLFLVWLLLSGPSLTSVKDMLDALSPKQQEGVEGNVARDLKIYDEYIGRIQQYIREDVVVHDQSGVTYVQVKDVSDAPKSLKGSSSIYERVLSVYGERWSDPLLGISSKDASDLNERYSSLLSNYAGLERKYLQLAAVLPFASRKQDISSVIPVSFEKVGDVGGSGSSPVVSRRPSGGEASTTVQIEVDEDPLTVEAVGVLFSALTSLATKYWLISQGRFADLIEFTKSHDERFVREAQAIITRLSYNSPFNFDVKVGATDIAQALVTTIDGITQAGERLKQIELANKVKEQEFQQAEQRFAEEIQRTQQQEAFEQEKRQLELARQQIELERLRLEVDQQRLGLLEARLDAQRKSLEHAFEIAHKVIGQLHPQANDTTKRMLVQTYVGDILQLSEISFTGVKVVEVKQTLEEKEKKDD